MQYEQILLLILSAFVFMMILCSVPPIVKADNMNPGIYSKDSSPFGVPYQEWLKRWWQWNMGFPSAEHPRLHYTPSRCTMNQNGPVWFLAHLLKRIAEVSRVQNINWIFQSECSKR
jgi:hypothetical protein